MSNEPASTQPAQMLIDATMLLRWQHLAPVGIVRLERLLASHLRFRSQLALAAIDEQEVGIGTVVTTLDRALRPPANERAHVPVVVVSFL